MMTNVSALRLQALANARALGHQVHHALVRKRFASAIIFCFLLIYLWAAYALVGQGLDFVSRLPLVGTMFTERLLFLLFFFFFIMLILSNATITGIGLFRRQETSWLLTLPVPPQSLVMWRTVEGLLLSSWGLVLLSAPILAAFGKSFHAGLSFYVLSLPAILCLTVIAANVSVWLLLIIVRWFRPWWWKVVAFLAAGLLIGLVFQYNSKSSPKKFAQGDISANFNEVLRHTRLCTHPMLPSSWVAETAINAGKGLPLRAQLQMLALLSSAMVCWLLTGALARLLFFTGWNNLFQRAQQLKPTPAKEKWTTRFAFATSSVLNLLGLRQATIALAVKDAKTFLREPMQWGQCALIFGLLLGYSWNLRNLGYGETDPFWTTVISYLNLTVCCLATSTLTTRFIFPQFSFEGQRFWILGMAPFPLPRVLKQKLCLNVCATAPITAVLVLVSCASLKLPFHTSVFFVTAMFMLNVGLNSLALSLGALLPNFRETNPAKIVSGFGGTLCLVTSFLYIVGGIGILLPPAISEHTSKNISPSQIIESEIACLIALALLTLIFGAAPYHFAKKRTKELAYLGNL